MSEFLIGHLDHLKERVAGAAIGASLDEVGGAKATPILTALTALTALAAADSDSAQGKSGLFAID